MILWFDHAELLGTCHGDACKCASNYCGSVGTKKQVPNAASFLFFSSSLCYVVLLNVSLSPLFGEVENLLDNGWVVICIAAFVRG